jgi:hypothetical protein
MREHDEAARQGCINCGEQHEGGYETEEVGSFCGQCWEYLRAHFAADSTQKDEELARLRAERDAALAKNRRLLADAGSMSNVLQALDIWPEMAEERIGLIRRLLKEHGDA